MDSSEYHSGISSRESFSRQSARTGSTMGGGGGGRVLKITTEMGASSMTGISAAMTQDAAQSIMVSREKEKKDMQELNDRLGTYLERVRFLESQNRKLVEDLENLRGRWGKDTASVKSTYAGELTESRKLIDETAKNKAAVEVEVARLQQELFDIRYLVDQAHNLRTADKDRIETFTTQLGDAETEIEQLRRRLQGLTEEMNRYEKDNGRINTELKAARSDLDKESVSRIDYQNQAQTLMEEIEFLRRVHDQVRIWTRKAFLASTTKTRLRR